MNGTAQRIYTSGIRNYSRTNCKGNMELWNVSKRRMEKFKDQDSTFYTVAPVQSHFVLNHKHVKIFSQNEIQVYVPAQRLSPNDILNCSWTKC